ncbi:MAG: hypothetical protein AB1330_12605 [Bacillota bacterium]
MRRVPLKREVRQKPAQERKRPNPRPAAGSAAAREETGSARTRDVARRQGGKRRRETTGGRPTKQEAHARSEAQKSALAGRHLNVRKQNMGETV